METKNRVKYHSYRAAYSRMNLAMKKGFYLEAIAIQEYTNLVKEYRSMLLKDIDKK